MLSDIISLVTGPLIIFVILFVLASAVTEFASSTFHWRSKNLAAFFRSVLGDSLVDDFYSKTMISFYVKGKIRPSYIPDHVVAQAILDLMRQRCADPSIPLTIGELKTVADGLRQFPISKVIISAINQSIEQGSAEIGTVRTYLQQWYSEMVNNIAGNYGLQIRRFLVVSVLLFAVIFNFDSISIVNKLLQNTALHSVIAAQADAISKELAAIPPDTQISVASQPVATPAAIGTAVVATPQLISQSNNAVSNSERRQELLTDLQTELNKLNIQVGWPDPENPGWQDPEFAGWLLKKTLGILITTFIVSLGAPFTFDLINRITYFRS